MIGMTTPWGPFTVHGMTFQRAQEFTSNNNPIYVVLKDGAGAPVTAEIRLKACKASPEDDFPTTTASEAHPASSAERRDASYLRMMGGWMEPVLSPTDMEYGVNLFDVCNAVVDMDMQTFRRTHISWVRSRSKTKQVSLSGSHLGPNTAPIE
eukprot:806081-Prymnesium_polylepis.1